MIEEFLAWPQPVYLLSGVLLGGALISRSMFWLRVLMCFSALIGIVYYSLLDQLPPTVGQISLLLVNLVQIFLLILEKKPVLLETEVREIYRQSFSMMSTREFRRLIKKGERGSEGDKLFCKEGSNLDRLYLLIRGKVSVSKGGQEVARLGSGDFIGEMSFLSGQPCLANVQAIGEASWLSWNSAHLENLKRGQQDLYIKMQSVLGMDVIRKLQNQTESNRTVAVTPDI